MVPEIPSMTDRIFCHFGPFFALPPLTRTYSRKYGHACDFLEKGQKKGKKNVNKGEKEQNV